MDKVLGARYISYTAAARTDKADRQVCMPKFDLPKTTTIKFGTSAADFLEENSQFKTKKMA